MEFAALLFPLLLLEGWALGVYLSPRPTFGRLSCRWTKVKHNRPHHSHTIRNAHGASLLITVCIPVRVAASNVHPEPHQTTTNPAADPTRSASCRGTADVCTGHRAQLKIVASSAATVLDYLRPKDFLTKMPVVNQINNGPGVRCRSACDSGLTGSSTALTPSP